MKGLYPIIRRQRVPMNEHARIAEAHSVTLASPASVPTIPPPQANPATSPTPPRSEDDRSPVGALTPPDRTSDLPIADALLPHVASATPAVPVCPNLPDQPPPQPPPTPTPSQPGNPQSTIGNLQSFVRLGSDHSCPPDQLRNLWQARVVLQSQQLAASAAARLCDLPNGPTSVGFGGARGGGKSFWLLAQMGVDDCQRVPGLKCLLLRKVGKSNLESFEDLRRRLFLKLPHEFNTSRGILTFLNGSRIVLGHYQCEKEIDAYLGLEYDVIGIEEATTLTARKHNDIVTVCRTSKPNWRPRIYSTTNPGGVGHTWYRRLYVEPWQQHRETNTRFIAATINDNAFTNVEYRDTLDNLTGWQKRAWRYGDWDIAAGQFFTTFRREVHVISSFDEHRPLEWSAALDYGFNHYTVVLLGCTDGDGNLFIVDEHAAREWVVERHAEAIKAMLKRHNVSLSGPYFDPLRRFVAGADIFARQANGATIAKQYSDLGISLRPANMDRINGWAEVLKRLGDPEASIRPTLFIHERCRRLVECLPSLQHDPNRPEDVLKVDPDEDGNGGDDPADTLRYLVASKPPKIELRKLKGF